MMKIDFFLFKKHIPFIFIGFLILSSCSSKDASRILTYPKSFNIDTLKTVAVFNNQNTYTEYKIKPYDKISIKNLQDPELLGARNVSVNTVNVSYQVNSNGEIVLPVIGAVKVEGLNKEQAKDKIEKLYGETLFKNPIIEISINNLKVTMLGAFGTEGNFDLENQKIDLIDMIGKAGGITDEANVKKIRIIRGNRENPELIVIDLSNINTLSNPKLKLQDGDIIIAESNKFAVFTKNFNGIITIASLATLLLNTYVILKSIN